MGKLLLLFTVVPLVELYLLLWVGRFLGVGPTITLVLVTGLVGAWLAKAEGLRVLRRWQESLTRGQVPEEGVFGGVLVLVGGTLLVTPGVLTDIVGFLLLVPPTRRWLIDRLRRRIERKIAEGSIHVVTYRAGAFHSRVPRRPGPGSGDSSPRTGSDVIEVDGETIEERREPRGRLPEGGASS